MLLYTKVAPPKVPKRRSRAGCMHCKEKKKKCNEQRPQCDRCIERDLKCEYEPVKPRKRRRVSSSLGPAGKDLSPLDDVQWSPTIFNYPNQAFFHHPNGDDWADFGVTSPQHDLTESEVGTFETDGGPFCDDGDVEVEDITRDPVLAEASSSTSTSLVRSGGAYPDLAMIAPSPVASPLLEFCAPAFEEFSNQKHRRHLIDHFCNTLSHLIVLKEDMGNPFRQLVLPLSQSSPPVMNAILALSSAHLENRGICLEEKSLDFHNCALQGLAQLINQNDPSQIEAVLGAIILLIYYEVLVRRGSSNIVTSHLRGALTIMQTQPQQPTPTSQFLERAFRFYDVIAALSFGSSPVSTSPLLVSFGSNRPFNLNMPLGSIDTLLGMATDLWPIIHRLSNLLQVRLDLRAAENTGETSKATVLRTELENSSAAIEMALTEWAPAIPPSALSPGQDLDGDSKLQSIINNAEAYRHAALVYLYRAIDGCPRRSQKVQLRTKQALHSCMGVVNWGGPMGALLWPLFVASCEAVSTEDRAVAKMAYNGIQSRQGMVNISHARAVVEEVWRRVDALSPDSDADVDWREVADEKGVNIVFG